MTRIQKRRMIKARQARNQRILWAMQDVIGLAAICIICVFVYGLVG